MQSRLLRLFVVALATALGGPLASAQIVIGQTAGFTGTVASSVKEATDGAKLYFDAVNARGGINGQKIELVSLDDASVRYQPLRRGSCRPAAACGSPRVWGFGRHAPG